VCALGGLVSLLMISTSRRVRSQVQPGLNHGCGHPCMCLDDAA
jgi:hypothetical protein